METQTAPNLGMDQIWHFVNQNWNVTGKLYWNTHFLRFQTQKHLFYRPIRLSFLNTQGSAVSPFQGQTFDWKKSQTVSFRCVEHIHAKVYIIYTSGMHAPPHPDPGKNGSPGRENFQDCPAPSRPKNALNWHVTPPRGFYFLPRPTPNFFLLPCPEVKKVCPVHPWITHPLSRGDLRLTKSHSSVMPSLCTRSALHSSSFFGMSLLNF